MRLDGPHEQAHTRPLPHDELVQLRLMAKEHSASPRTALDLLARIHRHQARIADRKLEGITTPRPEQLDLFDTLNLPRPA